MHREHLDISTHGYKGSVARQEWPSAILNLNITHKVDHNIHAMHHHLMNRAANASREYASDHNNANVNSEAYWKNRVNALLQRLD